MKTISITELNKRAFELHTNPHILIDDMTPQEFKEWIKDSSIKVLTNLLAVLTEYEMYEQCTIVKTAIQRIRQNNRRYRLHTLIRRSGYRLNVFAKTIYVKHDANVTEAIKELQNRFNYVIKTEI